MKNVIFLSLVVLISSCAVFTSKTTKLMKVQNSGIIQQPLLVDLDVQETKVVGTAQGKANLGMDVIKQDAIVNALEKNNSDVLVEPVFKTERRFRKITVNVSGYPAKYKNFRPITEDDLKILDNDKVKQAQVQEKTTESKRKKPIWKYILYGVGAYFVILIIVTIFLL